MSYNITSLIEESINLELNVSKLYLIFHNLFPEDSDFWWRLALEEKNHAALFRSGQEFFEELNKFPQNLIYNNLQSLRDTNINLRSLIKKCKNSPPSRTEAFNIAFKLEHSAVELHFQKFMVGDANSVLDKLFRTLNSYDKNHAIRIRDYMEKHGILMQSENK